jgi:hypothetical protein
MIVQNMVGQHWGSRVLIVITETRQNIVQFMDGRIALNHAQTVVEKRIIMNDKFYGGEDSMMNWIRCRECNKVINRKGKPKCHCREQFRKERR